MVSYRFFQFHLKAQQNKINKLSDRMKLNYFPTALQWKGIELTDNESLQTRDQSGQQSGWKKVGSCREPSSQWKLYYGNRKKNRQENLFNCNNNVRTSTSLGKPCHYFQRVAKARTILSTCFDTTQNSSSFNLISLSEIQQP